jgi:hypothetical protein
MAGYIKLHRGWHDSDQFTNEPYCERAAWCWLLTNAAWKDTTQRNHKGEVVQVRRGQYHTSIRALAGHWGWSIKRVRSFLKVLEKCAAAGTAGGQAGTIITICKYDEYQSVGQSEGTAKGTASRTDGAQPGHTKEEGKEGKEEKNSAAAPRPSDVSREVWTDFCRLRKAQKAPVTDTAVKGIRVQAMRAGWTLEDALAECVARGWRGFKADWVKASHGRDDEMTMPC